LSLDIDGKKYRPDICLYPNRKANYWHDIVKMKEMPLLAIEILSINQIIQEVTDKFEVYFKAGIKSCGLVMPVPSSISIFKDTDNKKPSLLSIKANYLILYLT
jgi:Uma2 family endonuclease